MKKKFRKCKKAKNRAKSQGPPVNRPASGFDDHQKKSRRFSFKHESQYQTVGDPLKLCSIKTETTTVPKPKTVVLKESNTRSNPIIAETRNVGKSKSMLKSVTVT